MAAIAIVLGVGQPLVAQIVTFILVRAVDRMYCPDLPGGGKASSTLPVRM